MERTDLTRRRRAPHRWKQLLPLAAILLVGVAWLTYLVLGSTLLPERLRSTAERAGLSLDFDSARSFVPGKLHVREPELSDAGAGWRIGAQRVICEFDLLALLLGSTRIGALEAQGVVVDIDSTPGKSPAHSRPASRRQGRAPGAPGLYLGRALRLRSRRAPAEHSHRRAPPRQATRQRGQGKRLGVRCQAGRPARCTGHGRALLTRGGACRVWSGALKTPKARLNANAASSAYHRIQTRLEIETASLDLSKGFDFRGDLLVQGDDASLLLDLAAANETVRWTLSLLEGRSFMLHARLANQGDALTLSELRLKAAGISAQGAISADNHGTRGAFLLRGPLAVGVSLQSGTISSETPVSEHWLEARLQDLSLPR